MRNGPDGVVYRSYMSHRDRPQINYYNLFYLIGGKQSPPLFGQQLYPKSPMFVYISPAQHPFLSGDVPSRHFKDGPNENISMFAYIKIPNIAPNTNDKTNATHDFDLFVCFFVVFFTVFFMTSYPYY